MKTTNKALSQAQLEILAWMGSHKGRANIGHQATNRTLSRESAKSLAKMGLIECAGATVWEHGVGNTVAYRVTEAGRALICIGRMFRTFHK